MNNLERYQTLSTSSELDPNSPDFQGTKSHDALEFQGAKSPSEILENTDFVTRTYGDKLDYFLDNLYEDCDDKNRHDPNYYTYSLGLSQICSDEKQDQLIRKRAAGESVRDPEVMENLKQALLEAGDLKSEIIKDPFLRQKHQDYLTRDQNDQSQPDELTELIWKLDRDFDSSQYAWAVLFDPDYLERTYPGYEPESTKNFIRDAIAVGKLTPAEILKDPYLRGRRIQLHTENPDSLSSDNEWVNAFWNLDKGFRYTPEHIDWVDTVSNAHPETYQVAEDDPEIAKLTEEVLAQIPDQKLKAIVKTYQIDARKGDELLLETLLAPLGLAHNKPQLSHYPGVDAKEKAAYSREKNQITLYEDKFTAPPRRLIDRFLQPKPDDPLFDRIAAISHELWHAHQAIGDNVDSARREKYDLNYECYFDVRIHDGDKNELKKRYKGQLIEAEALNFGEAAKQRAKKLWYN